MTFVEADLIDNSRTIKSTESYNTLIEFLIEHYPTGFNKHCDISINNKNIHLDDYNIELKEDDIIVLLLRPGVTAAMVGGSVIWAFVANVAISMAIGYVMQTLFAPDPLVEQLETSQQTNSGSSVYNLNSKQNEAKLGQSIPVIYGTVRTYPAMIMEPYKQTIDNVEYLNHLLCIGQGTYSIDDLFIDKTSVLNHPDVEYCLLNQSDFTHIPNAVNTKLSYSGNDTFDSDVVETLSTPTNYDMRTYKMSSHTSINFSNWIDINADTGTGYWREAVVYIYGGTNYSSYSVDSEVPEVGDLMRAEFADPEDSSTEFNFYGTIQSINTNGYAETDIRYEKWYSLIRVIGSYPDNLDYGFKGKETRTSSARGTSNYNSRIVADTSISGATHYLGTGSDHNLYDLVLDDKFGTTIDASRNGKFRFGDLTLHGDYAKVAWIKKDTGTYYNDGAEEWQTEYRVYFNLLQGTANTSTTRAEATAGVFSIYTSTNFTKYSNYFVYKKPNEQLLKANMTISLQAGYYITKKENGDKIPVVGPYMDRRLSRVGETGYVSDKIYFEGDKNTYLDGFKFDHTIAFSNEAVGHEEISIRPFRPEGNNAGSAEGMVLNKLTKYYEPVSHSDYDNITLLYVRIKATNAISSIGQMKVNALVTRTDQSNTLESVAKDIYANSNYGGGLNINEVTFPGGGGTELINGSFDSTMTVFDAIKAVANPHKYSVTPNGINIEIKPDTTQPYNVALYNEYNIVKDSFGVDLIIQEQYQQYDCYKVAYRDAITFEELYEYYPLHGYKPKTIKTFGVTSSTIAANFAKYQWKQFFGRKKIINFDTDIQGLIPNFKDKILVSHNSINWGLDAGYIIAINGRDISLSEFVESGISSGVIYFKRLNGSSTNAYNWTGGDGQRHILLSTDLEPGIDINSYYTLGIPKEFLVTDIKPKGETVTISAINYDSSIYS